jgi:two-component SAPR family response regulator
MPGQKQANTDVTKNIKIYTLGEFRIVSKNGETYRASSRSNRLWTLFKFLLINSNKAIAPEFLLETVSPETDYTDPANAVYNMIYRLRKLLYSESVFENSKEIISFTNGYYKLNFSGDVWIDFIELEKSFNIAEKIKNDDPQQAAEYYQNAFEIYGGELLPELVCESWVFPKRTYYRNLYLKIIANLTSLYAHKKLYGAVVEVCRQAVSMEPYEEEIRVQLMENLIRIGKIREAKDCYEKTIDVLEKEFGINPTPELQRIAQLLKSEYVQIKSGGKAVPQIMEEQDGAFFCDYRDFYTIYILEKRKCERSGEALCPFYIEFDNGKNTFNSNAFKTSAIKEFKQTLIKGLRKGDMVSLVNKSRFMILLNNAGFQTVNLVMDRMIAQFHQRSAYKDVVLEMEFCLSLPKPKRI